MTNGSDAVSSGWSFEGRNGYELSFGAAFCLAATMFAASAIVALLLQSQSTTLTALGFSGLTVPDAISLETSVHFAWGASWDQIPNIQTFLGTVLLYFPITFWGAPYAAVVNVTLLALSAALFGSLLQKLQIQDRTGAWLFGVVFVATNLYVISCLFFPNKEIPVIFLTTLFVWSLLADKWQISLLCALLCYWFRDGYALILGMVLVVALARRFTFASGGVLSLTFLILLFFAFPISDLQTLDNSLQRNVDLGTQIAGDKFSSLGEVAAYAVRLIGNTLNLGLRPQMTDMNGDIYVLGIGYWQFGVVLLGGVLWACRNAATNNMPRSIVALVIAVVLAGLSYGTFVQPRYMMPLVFLLALGMAEDRSIRLLTLFATLILPPIFLWLDLLPPLAQV